MAHTRLSTQSLLALCLAIATFVARKTATANELHVYDGFGLVAAFSNTNITSVVLSTSELTLREEHWYNVTIPVLLERNLTLRGDPRAPGPPLLSPVARGKVRFLG